MITNFTSESLFSHLIQEELTIRFNSINHLVDSITDFKRT